MHFATNHFTWEKNFFGEVPQRTVFLGMCVALFYAFTKISFAEWVDPLEPLLLIIAATIFFSYAGNRRRSFPVWLLIPAVAVPLITWGQTSIYYPELAASSPRAEHIARHFLFIFIAFLIGGSTRNLFIFWSTAIFGLIFAPWSLGEGYAEFVAALNGTRVDFNIQNAQHTGLLHGAAALGLLIFSKRVFVSQGKFQLLRIGLWLLTLLYLIFVVFASQTRAAVLALMFALFAALVTYIAHLYNRPRSASVNPEARGSYKRRLGYMLLVLTAIGVTIGVAAYYADGTIKRWKAESAVITPLLQGNFDDIPTTSGGLRLHSWRAAAEWIAEKPILGWGPRGGALVMEETEWLQAYTGGHFGHLHSSYFEIMTRYGMAGFSIYLGLAIWFGVQLWLAWRRHDIPGDFTLFFFSFFGYWLIVNAFESYLFYWTGTYLFNVVCTGLLTMIWKSQASRERNRTVSQLPTHAHKYEVARNDPAG